MLTNSGVEVRPLQPVRTFIAGHVLRFGYVDRDRDGKPVVTVKEFPAGSEVRESDVPAEKDGVDPGELERLIASGALKYPSEVMAPEQIQAQLDENQRLREELATLRAAQAAGAGGQRTEDLLEQTEAQIEQAKATAATTRGRHNP